MLLLLAACGAPASEGPVAWNPPGVPAAPVAPIAPVAPPAPQLTASTPTIQAPQEKAPTRARRPAILSVTNQSFLFHDEMDRVEAVAREQLASASDVPVDVVPAERLRALALVAKKGKLREDGPACARPPTAQEAVAAAFPKLLRAELYASCELDGPCSASLRVTDGTYLEHSFNDGNTLAEAFVSPQDPLDVASWEAAFSASPVKVPAPSSGSLMGFGSLISDGPQIAIDRIESRGAWSSALVAADFEADAKALTKSCGKAGWLTEDVLVEVGGGGKVTRCEVTAREGETPPPCLCTTLSAHVFAPGSGKRRARISLGKRGGGNGVSAWNGKGGLGGRESKHVEVDETGGTFDEPMEVGRARGEAMKSCFSAEGPQTTFELRSALDETGKVTSVKLSKRAEMTEGEARCVGKAAAHFLYRCPDHVGDEAWGKYMVLRPTKPTKPAKP
jgi:hypothetical protein